MNDSIRKIPVMRSAVHHVVMVVPAGMPVFEAAVPCEVFGIDRSDITSP